MDGCVLLIQHLLHREVPPQSAACKRVPHHQRGRSRFFLCARVGPRRRLRPAATRLQIFAGGTCAIPAHQPECLPAVGLRSAGSHKSSQRLDLAWVQLLKRDACCTRTSARLRTLTFTWDKDVCEVCYCQFMRVCRRRVHHQSRIRNS